MRAIELAATGGPDVLRLVEIDDPVPGEGELLVEVAAAGVNMIDTYFRSGQYPRALPSVLGSEGAGTVVAVGPGVTTHGEGDLVAWSDGPGSYAERVVVAADKAVQAPDGTDPHVAAALLLQGMTAHFLTHSTKRLTSEDTVLAWAAAGGVGRLLVQLAKRRGARVIACTSTPEKAQDVAALGADEVLLYRDVDVAASVRELTDGEGVDVVYDSVGAASFETSLDCLRIRGLMVLYGASSGPVSSVDPQVLNQKGSLYLTRPGLGSYVTTRDELEWRAGTLFDLVAGGQLDVAIHERYPLEQAARAHTDLESGTTSGKLLLVP